MKKPIFKTTEFWVMILASLIPAIERFFEINLPDEIIYGMVGYIFSRGWKKISDIGE